MLSLKLSRQLRMRVASPEELTWLCFYWRGNKGGRTHECSHHGAHCHPGRETHSLAGSMGQTEKAPGMDEGRGRSQGSSALSLSGSYHRTFLGPFGGSVSDCHRLDKAAGLWFGLDPALDTPDHRSYRRRIGGGVPGD